MGFDESDDRILPVVIAIESDESEDIKRPELSQVIVYDPDDQKILFKKMRF
jgi:hypothetical protein